jgi:hypothetical protein
MKQAMGLVFLRWPDSNLNMSSTANDVAVGLNASAGLQLNCTEFVLDYTNSFNPDVFGIGVYPYSGGVG